MLDEFAALDATFAEAGTFRSLGDRPLVVLTAAAPIASEDLAALKLTKEQGQRLQAAWFDLHDDEASWSSRSRHVRVSDAHHYIQFDRPDIVIEQVREIVTDVRAGHVGPEPGADAH
jgi:hypothetical protein